MYRPFLFGRTIVRYVGNDDGPLYGARQYTASARKMHRVHYQLSACLKETGVNGVIIAEPAAGLVSNEDCSSFSSTYISRIVEELQDDNFMIVLHNCGNTGHCTAAMVETKAAGLHFGNKIDMVQVLQECPEDILVMGNIDPVAYSRWQHPRSQKRNT